MFQTLRAFAICAVVVVASSAAWAESLLPGGIEAVAVAEMAALAEHNPANPGGFTAGSWDINVYGGGIASLGAKNMNIYFGTVGFEYFIWDDISLSAEAVGYYVDQKAHDDAPGGGFNLLGRWYFLHCGRFSPFVEGSLGLGSFTERVPGPEGTHFNFILQAGVGAKWQLIDRLALQGGFRYMHLSNARLDGKDRNPGFDGIGGYLGVSLDF